MTPRFNGGLRAALVLATRPGWAVALVVAVWGYGLSSNNRFPGRSPEDIP